MPKKSNEDKDIEYLYVLISKEMGRDGTPTHNDKILSVYKSQKDAEVMIEAHNEHGKSNWGFEISQTDEFEILEIPREITFGQLLPSWKEDMKRMEDMLSELMEEVVDTENQNG